MKDWSERQIEEHYRQRFIETDGYDPLDPFEEQDIDFWEEDEYLQESLEQYKSGELTPHELIKDRCENNEEGGE